MVGGAPGLGGGPTQPPTAWEAESQAFVEVTKKYVMGMTRDSMAEVVPFTQTEYDEVFKYKAESGRPTLHPLLFLRAGAAGGYELEEQNWQEHYQELLNELPANVKRLIEQEMNKPFQERDPDFVIVNSILKTTAMAIDWLATVTEPIQPNTRAEQNYFKSVALPFLALNAVSEQSEAVVDSAQAWLNLIGANHPHHDALHGLLADTKTALTALKNVRQRILSGDTGPEIRQGFLQIAHDFDRLYRGYQTAALGNDLFILGAQIQALATVTAAWSLKDGSQSLLLAHAIAARGLSTIESDIGIIGGTYTTAVDSLLEGVLSVFELGPKTEIAELTDVYHSLAELKGDQYG